MTIATNPRHLRNAAILAGLSIAATLLVAAPFIAHNAAVEQSRSIRDTHATSIQRQATNRSHEQLDFYAERASIAAHDAAAETIVRANAVIDETRTKVDPAALTASVAALHSSVILSTSKTEQLTGHTESQIAATVAAAAEVDRLAAEAAARAAAAAAEQLRIANTPDGARATARSMAASQYGWGDAQFSCLAQLWQKESGWSFTAHNPSGGAHGIPQSLPGSKMASAGPDWMTSAATQISWGLGYIKGSYGSPCNAWAHSVANNWY